MPQLRLAPAGEDPAPELPSLERDPDGAPPAPAGTRTARRPAVLPWRLVPGIPDPETAPPPADSAPA